MEITEIEIGKTYQILYRGTPAEAVAVATKPEGESLVLWTTSSRPAVLLRLSTGREITRSPKALSTGKRFETLGTEGEN